jgi:hypothetical protein
VTVATRPDPGTVRVELDEHWLGCWCLFGFLEMESYLAAWAAFEQYLSTHPQPDEGAA